MNVAIMSVVSIGIKLYKWNVLTVSKFSAFFTEILNFDMYMYSTLFIIYSSMLLGIY